MLTTPHNATIALSKNEKPHNQSGVPPHKRADRPPVRGLASTEGQKHETTNKPSEQDNCLKKIGSAVCLFANSLDSRP